MLGVDQAPEKVAQKIPSLPCHRTAAPVTLKILASDLECYCCYERTWVGKKLINGIQEALRLPFDAQAANILYFAAHVRRLRYTAKLIYCLFVAWVDGRSCDPVWHVCNCQAPLASPVRLFPLLHAILSLPAVMTKALHFIFWAIACFEATAPRQGCSTSCAAALVARNTLKRLLPIR